jgi:hypothetical protein
MKEEDKHFLALASTTDECTAGENDQYEKKKSRRKRKAKKFYNDYSSPIFRFEPIDEEMLRLMQMDPDDFIRPVK